ITTGGVVIPGLRRLEPNGAPVQAMVDAATRLLDALDPAQREAMTFALDAREWRMWNNTEMYLFVYGLAARGGVGRRSPADPRGHPDDARRPRFREDPPYDVAERLSREADECARGAGGMELQLLAVRTAVDLGAVG